jgi:hypothetical protein
MKAKKLVVTALTFVGLFVCQQIAEAGCSPSEDESHVDGILEQIRMTGGQQNFARSTAEAQEDVQIFYQGIMHVSIITI